MKTWVSRVNRLGEAADDYPQAAHAALSKSLQFEWSYLQRVIPNCEKLFTTLQDVINQTFWPTLFQASVSEPETKLFSLPACLGGMGV